MNTLHTTYDDEEPEELRTLKQKLAALRCSCLDQGHWVGWQHKNPLLQSLRLGKDKQIQASPPVARNKVIMVISNCTLTQDPYIPPQMQATKTTSHGTLTEFVHFLESKPLKVTVSNQNFVEPLCNTVSNQIFSEHFLDTVPKGSSDPCFKAVINQNVGEQLSDALYNQTLTEPGFDNIKNQTFTEPCFNAVSNQTFAEPYFNAVSNQTIKEPSFNAVNHQTFTEPCFNAVSNQIFSEPCCNAVSNPTFSEPCFNAASNQTFTEPCFNYVNNQACTDPVCNKTSAEPYINAVNNQNVAESCCNAVSNQVCSAPSFNAISNKTFKEPWSNTASNQTFTEPCVNSVSNQACQDPVCKQIPTEPNVNAVKNQTFTEPCFNSVNNQVCTEPCRDVVRNQTSKAPHTEAVNIQKLTEPCLDAVSIQKFINFLNTVNNQVSAESNFHAVSDENPKSDYVKVNDKNVTKPHVDSVSNQTGNNRLKKPFFNTADTQKFRSFFNATDNQTFSEPCFNTVINQTITEPCTKVSNQTCTENCSNTVSDETLTEPHFITASKQTFTEISPNRVDRQTYRRGCLKVREPSNSRRQAYTETYLQTASKQTLADDLISSQPKLVSVNTEAAPPSCILTLNFLNDLTSKVLKDEQMETDQTMFLNDQFTEKHISCLEKVTSFTNIKPVLKLPSLFFAEAMNEFISNDIGPVEVTSKISQCNSCIRGPREVKFAFDDSDPDADLLSVTTSSELENLTPIAPRSSRKHKTIENGTQGEEMGSEIDEETNVTESLQDEIILANNPCVEELIESIKPPFNEDYYYSLLKNNSDEKVQYCKFCCRK